MITWFTWLIHFHKILSTIYFHVMFILLIYSHTWFYTRFIYFHRWFIYFHLWFYLHDSLVFTCDFFYTVDLFTRDFTLTYIFTWFFISYLFTCYFYTINLCSHIIVYYFVFTCNFSILCLLSHNFYTLIFFIYFLCSLLFNVISYRWFIFFTWFLHNSFISM